MLTCPTIEKRVIRGHYDLSTPFYRLLWGPHIHHGLWEADESPRLAQVQLTERLANLAGVAGGQALLDVGCGMGGSSIHLARTRGCRAVGVTLSRLQQYWAATSARWHGVRQKTEFRRADVEQVDFPPRSFDVVWSIECTEHLFDKPRFFERAAAWLKPGGTMAICAWLAGDELNRQRMQQVLDVCEGFFCPSLGSSSDYVAWMQNAGLAVSDVQNWTDRVARTWEICRRRVERARVRWLARWIDRDSVTFLDCFETILAAYQSGAMKYGCFIANKPNNT
jgi:cyclopropane fatty-acyl-phospholipid synthase-like methyltransferase